MSCVAAAALKPTHIEVFPTFDGATINPSSPRPIPPPSASSSSGHPVVKVSLKLSDNASSMLSKMPNPNSSLVLYSRASLIIPSISGYASKSPFLIMSCALFIALVRFCCLKNFSDVSSTRSRPLSCMFSIASTISRAN